MVDDAFFGRGIEVYRFLAIFFCIRGLLNPLRAPEPLPILNPSNFVPKTGFQL